MLLISDALGIEEAEEGAADPALVRNLLRLAEVLRRARYSNEAIAGEAEGVAHIRAGNPAARKEREPRTVIDFAKARAERHIAERAGAPKRGGRPWPS